MLTLCHAPCAAWLCHHTRAWLGHHASSPPARRIDEAAELAADVRTELAESRKKLRELADAEKEGRKRKKAAALALATVSGSVQGLGFSSCGTLLAAWCLLPLHAAAAADACCTRCALQAAAERQLREQGKLPADGAAAGAAASNGGAAGGTADAAPVSEGGAEQAAAKKLKATTHDLLKRVAGPGAAGKACTQSPAFVCMWLSSVQLCTAQCLSRNAD